MLVTSSLLERTESIHAKWDERCKDVLLILKTLLTHVVTLSVFKHIENIYGVQTQKEHSKFFSIITLIAVWISAAFNYLQ